MKWFVGMPKNIFQGNSNGFFGKEMQENFANGFFGNVKRFFSGNSKRFFGARNTRKNFRPPHKNFPKFASKFGNKLVTKRVAKDIDPTRIKRIKLTNKDKIRLRLEKNNYFPQEKKPGFFSTLKRTILDYFLPFPPPPPLDDKRNALPDHRKNKNGSQR